MTACNHTTNLPPSKPSNPPLTWGKDDTEEGQFGKQYFRDILKDKNAELNRSYPSLLGEQEIKIDQNEELILLSKEERAKFYLPWKHSMIVKLVGKKISTNIYKQNSLSYEKLLKI